MTKKYLIETFGCQMNFHDSERMAGLLEQAGYEPTDESREADVVVINTCSVRERAEDKLYSRLGELRADAQELGRRPVLAVTGCVAQQEGAALRKRSKDIDVILGTQRLKMLPMLVEQAQAGSHTHPSVDISPHDDVSFPLGIARRGDPVKAYVNIIEGCNDFCSFCVVPYTRGHERMRPVRDILDEVREAADTGRREVQLLGQIVNHYEAPDDDACDFAELLERVARIEGIERIRFASPHPRHVNPRLIDALRDIPQVCKHLHLPVQSGSSRVLKNMRRRYTRESYLELVEQVRAGVPDIALSTDMIVGFPGETLEDFSLTLSLVEQVRFHSMFSFKYSPRPNTLAEKRLPDDVPEPEKSRRGGEMQALQKTIQTALHEAAVGRVFDVLVDSTSRKREWELSGRTTGNTVVNFPAPMKTSGEPDWVGRTIGVRITEAGPNSLRGTAGPHAD
ncbi:MAG: tRNA (N6-isopentenyl adenosine(37)-C2)-methylthiotransferase MiaB [Acidobacteriota bacterium]